MQLQFLSQSIIPLFSSLPLFPPSPPLTLSLSTCCREMIKEYMKRMELQKELEEATIRVAKKGEPMDPEMLNPARKRPPVELSDEEKEQKILLVKRWTRYNMEEHKAQLQQLQGMMDSRRRALRELKKVSLPLYQQALDLRTNLFPFEWTGPPATPPLPGYDPPPNLHE